MIEKLVEFTSKLKFFSDWSNIPSYVKANTHYKCCENLKFEFYKRG